MTGTLVGYARTSTVEQEAGLEAQVAAVGSVTKTRPLSPFRTPVIPGRRRSEIP